MKVVLATNNTHKAKEIKDILANLKAEIFSLEDFPPYAIPEERGKTFEENALIKAREAFKHTRIISLADDSGLEVDVLDRSPGIMSARFAGPGCTYKDNNIKLLNLMKDVPDEKRGVTFYDIMARSTDNETAREAFQNLTDMEREHIQIFEEMLDEADKYQPPETLTEEYAGYLQALVDSAHRRLVVETH